jgi:hypothetical protein
LTGSGEADVWIHATSVPLDERAEMTGQARVDNNVMCEPDTENTGVLNRGGHYSFVLGDKSVLIESQTPCGAIASPHSRQ